MDELQRGMVPRKLTRILIPIALILVTASSASGQLVFSVCRETCPDPLRDPAGAAMCAARIAACESKLTLYNSYMAQMGAGVTTYQLPATYRELLQPFYSNNLSTWRFGFSNRQPADNATTDCATTYFNRAGFVTLLRDGNLDALWQWLFHELAHFDQCRILGSRDAYSKMWFGHLEVAFIQNNNIETIHDRMLMEGAADAVSTRVFDATRTLRDRTGRLVRPISVVLKGPSGQVLGSKVTIMQGQAYRVSATVSGGSQPMDRNWIWMLPGSTFFQAASTRVLDEGNAFNAGSTSLGTHRVRLIVAQPESNLVPAVKELIVEVVRPRAVSEITR